MEGVTGAVGENHQAARDAGNAFRAIWCPVFGSGTKGAYVQGRSPACSTTGKGRTFRSGA